MFCSFVYYNTCLCGLSILSFVPPLIRRATPRYLSTEKLVKTARIKGADEANRWTVEPMHVGVQNTQRDVHNVPHSMEPCE